MTDKLIREKAITRQKRKARMLRSLQIYLSDMTDEDLDLIETAMEPAIGRIVMGLE